MSNSVTVSRKYKTKSLQSSIVVFLPLYAVSVRYSFFLFLETWIPLVVYTETSQYSGAFNPGLTNNRNHDEEQPE